MGILTNMAYREFEDKELRLMTKFVDSKTSDNYPSIVKRAVKVCYPKTTMEEFKKLEIPDDTVLMLYIKSKIKKLHTDKNFQVHLLEPLLRSDGFVTSIIRAYMRVKNYELAGRFGGDASHTSIRNMVLTTSLAERISQIILDGTFARNKNLFKTEVLRHIDYIAQDEKLFQPPLPKMQPLTGVDEERIKRLYMLLRGVEREKRNIYQVSVVPLGLQYKNSKGVLLIRPDYVIDVSRRHLIYDGTKDTSIRYFLLGLMSALDDVTICTEDEKDLLRNVIKLAFDLRKTM